MLHKTKPGLVPLFSTIIALFLGMEFWELFPGNLFSPLGQAVATLAAAAVFFAVLRWLANGDALPHRPLQSHRRPRLGLLAHDRRYVFRMAKWHKGRKVCPAHGGQ